MVGMVLGVGIFKAPSMVAGNTADAYQFLGAWLFGGFASLCGALVYAELSSRYPHTGGEYSFLARGLGRGPSLLFSSWRINVVKTRTTAAVSFVFGDYASEIYSFGEKSSAIWAGIGVVVLTLVNFVGTLHSKLMQKVMEITLIAALIGMAIAALVVGGPVQTQPAQPVDAGKLSYGLAMVFVLLTYGGWNEAAYIAGEVRDARRNMTRILVWGIVAVTALYMLVNVGYLVALGMTGMAQSKAVAADVMRMVAGDKGAIVLALIVCVSAFTTMNAAIFTGARTNFALGQDYRLFGFLGNWRERGSTPANALILQGVVSLLLVYVGSTTPDGFSAMVAYTSPVFWTFFLLTGVTLFVFRARGGEAPAFKVPLFPLTPLIFIGTCAYMLWSSIDYIRNPIFGPKFGDMVLGGIVIMAVGIPMYWLARRK